MRARVDRLGHEFTPLTQAGAVGGLGQLAWMARVLTSRDFLSVFVDALRDFIVLNQDPLYSSEVCALLVCVMTAPTACELHKRSLSRSLSSSLLDPFSFSPRPAILTLDTRTTLPPCSHSSLSSSQLPLSWLHQRLKICPACPLVAHAAWGEFVSSSQQLKCQAQG